MKELFTIQNEKKNVDKLTYTLMSLQDQQTKQDKEFVFCQMFKKLSGKDDKYAKYATKDDKENSINFGIMSQDAIKLTYAIDSFLNKKIFSQEDLRETYDYLDSIGVNIQSMKKEGIEGTSDDGKKFKQKDRIMITISLYRPGKGGALKVFNIMINLTIVEKGDKKEFHVYNGAFSIGNKNSDNEKMKTYFTNASFFEIAHFNTLLKKV